MPRYTTIDGKYTTQAVALLTRNQLLNHVCVATTNNDIHSYVLQEEKVPFFGIFVWWKDNKYKFMIQTNN